MKNFLKIAVVLSFSVVYTLPSYAASQADIMAFQTNLSEMNRLKPLQNPRNEMARDALGSTLIDRENKVIGDVEDILVDVRGNVKTIYTELDRLHLGGAVFLDYDDLSIKIASNGYQIGMNSEEISTAYPELLSDIETAAGGGELISVENLLGSDVIGTNGTRLGEIYEVLFDQSGSYVQGVYLNVDYKTIRGRGIAIPFDALSFEQKSNRMKVMIDKDYAATVVKNLQGN